MTKRNYVIHNDKSLKNKHKVNVEKKNMKNPQEEVIAKEKAIWEEKNKK